MKRSTLVRIARSPISSRDASERNVSVEAMKNPEASRAASCAGSTSPNTLVNTAATHMKSGALSK